MEALIIGIDVGSQSNLGTKNGAKDLIKELNLTYLLGYSEKKDSFGKLRHYSPSINRLDFTEQKTIFKMDRHIKQKTP